MQMPRGHGDIHTNLEAPVKTKNGRGGPMVLNLQSMHSHKVLQQSSQMIVYLICVLIWAFITDCAHL